jgi:hypothetical protein
MEKARKVVVSKLNSGTILASYERRGLLERLYEI